MVHWQILLIGYLNNENILFKKMIHINIIIQIKNAGYYKFFK